MTHAEIVAAYVGGLTTAEVAKECGKTISTVRRILVKAGCMRSIRQAARISAAKGRMGRKLGTRVTLSAQAKANIAAAAQNRPARGYSLKPSGYLEVTCGENKFRRMHRVIAEKMLGRKLLATEVVHHIAHDKTNNDPSNLAVMSASEHSSLHAREREPLRNRNEKGQFA